MRYKLTIAYDGAAYCGWQRQPDPVPTVQRTIELAAGAIVSHPVTVAGSSRTDTGVHARGQVAVMETTCPLEPQRLRMAINSRLPADISIRQLEPCSAEFDVSRATCKRYRYLIWNQRDRPIFQRHYVYHYWHPLQLEPMRQACRQFLGTHDFMAFSSRTEDRLSTVRQIYHCDIGQRGPIMIFSVEGSGFLYHMVRNMVGTIIEVGRGHWPGDCIPRILESKDRGQAGPCAPAQGLCLQWIRF
ncbi:MAG: tRNA pseudouridine(38-40) synthase TruA [Phycisphaerae bacterium]